MVPLNVNEKQLVEALLIQVLGECLEVELLAVDSQFESQAVFRLLDSLKIGLIIVWRRLKRRVNPPDVLSVKDQVDVEGARACTFPARFNHLERINYQKKK